MNQAQQNGRPILAADALARASHQKMPGCCRRRSAICFGSGLLLALILATGCGQAPSTQQQWQQTLRDNSLSPQEKFQTVAGQMFDLESVDCEPLQGGFSVSLTVLGTDPSGIVKTVADRDAATQKRALKQFYLRTLIAQLQNYVHYTRVHHLQKVHVQLSVLDVTGQDVQTSRSVAYELDLKADQFDAFLEAANLATAPAIEKCETIWNVQHDAWK